MFCLRYQFIRVPLSFQRNGAVLLQSKRKAVCFIRRNIIQNELGIFCSLVAGFGLYRNLRIARQLVTAVNFRLNSLFGVNKVGFHVPCGDVAVQCHCIAIPLEDCFQGDGFLAHGYFQTVGAVRQLSALGISHSGTVFNQLPFFEVIACCRNSRKGGADARGNRCTGGKIRITAFHFAALVGSGCQSNGFAFEVHPYGCCRCICFQSQSIRIVCISRLFARLIIAMLNCPMVHHIALEGFCIQLNFRIGYIKTACLAGCSDSCSTCIFGSIFLVILFRDDIQQVSYTDHMICTGTICDFIVSVPIFRCRCRFARCNHIVAGERVFTNEVLNCIAGRILNRVGQVQRIQFIGSHFIFIADRLGLIFRVRNI